MCFALLWKGRLKEWERIRLLVSGKVVTHLVKYGGGWHIDGGWFHGCACILDVESLCLARRVVLEGQRVETQECVKDCSSSMLAGQLLADCAWLSGKLYEGTTWLTEAYPCALSRRVDQRRPPM